MIALALIFGQLRSVAPPRPTHARSRSATGAHQMREPAAAHISTNGQWELTLVQLQAGTTLRQPFGICQPSPTLHAAVLGGSVTAGLTYAVRQDPKRFLYHAKFAARLSARIGGAVHMWNGGIPATGPWIANICTRARRPHVFNMLLVEARATHTRTLHHPAAEIAGHAHDCPAIACAVRD